MIPCFWPGAQNLRAPVGHQGNLQVLNNKNHHSSWHWETVNGKLQYIEPELNKNIKHVWSVKWRFSMVFWNPIDLLTFFEDIHCFLRSSSYFHRPLHWCGSHLPVRLFGDFMSKALQFFVVLLVKTSLKSHQIYHFVISAMYMLVQMWKPIDLMKDVASSLSPLISDKLLFATVLGHFTKWPNHLATRSSRGGKGNNWVIEAFWIVGLALSNQWVMDHDHWISLNIIEYHWILYDVLKMLCMDAWNAHCWTFYILYVAISFGAAKCHESCYLPAEPVATALLEGYGFRGKATPGRVGSTLVVVFCCQRLVLFLNWQYTYDYVCTLTVWSS